MSDDPAAVPLSKKEEFEKVVQGAVDLIELPIEPGYNENMMSMRLTCDPIPCEHRPFIYYLVTGGILPAITHWFTEWHLGFRRYQSGSVTYWYLPAQDTSASVE